jgi:anti-sigma factor RsiW
VNGDEFDELLGAYALDAVSDDERLEIEAYLAVNPRARAEVAQHRETATLLAFTGAPAPSGLWDKIAASLDERAPAAHTVLAPVLQLEDRRARRRAAVSRWVAVGAASAAAVAAIAILSAKVADQRNELGALRAENVTSQLAGAASKALADNTARKARLVSTDGTHSAEVAVEGSTGYLVANGLAPLGNDKTYQLWGVIDGKVISLGVLGAHPTVVVFPADPHLATLVLTEEAAGGVPVSKEPPALAGNLTS